MLKYKSIFQTKGVKHTQMNSTIIYNILNNDTLRKSCLDKVNSYEASQSNSPNKTELIRFSRHISLEAFFQNINNSNIELDNHSHNAANNSIQNMDCILAELSTIACNDTEQDDDTVLLLQLSNTLDIFLNQLSASDKKIYLYRYFFAYPIENIASICKTQAHNIQKTLTTCNHKLKDLIKKNNLDCNSKALLLSFTDIDDSCLLAVTSDDSKTVGSNDEKPKKSKRLFSWPVFLNVLFSITIIVLAVLNIAQFTQSKASDNTKETETSTNDTIDTTVFNPELAYTYIDGKKNINVEELLKFESSAVGFEQPFTYITDRFSGTFVPIKLADEIPLSDYIGEEIPELAEDYKAYYRLMGSDSLQYIIREFNDVYTLYYLNGVFVHNAAGLDDPESAMKYHQILSNFYGINGSIEIQEIYVMTYTWDTGYADSYTKKVIDSENDLAEVYSALRTSVCKGKSIDDYILENKLSHDFIRNNSVQVYIQPKVGTIIDRLTYYPDGNFFYDMDTNLIYEPIESDYDNYLVEMLSFNIRKEEPIDPELWKIYLNCVDADPHSLAVSLQGDPTQKLHGLYIGSEYTIEKLENDSWVSVPTGSYTVSRPFTPFERKIESTSMRDMLYFQHREKYGSLAAGRYRIIITLYDSNSEDLTNPNHRDFSAEFIINEDNSNIKININTYSTTPTY